MILLIDLGFTNMGWAVVNPRSQNKPFEVLNSGVISTDKKKGVLVSHDSSRRVRELFRGLCQIRQEFEINYICAEFPHGGAKSAAAIKAMANASAVVSCFAEAHHISLEIVSPADVKKTIRDKGSVSKDEIMENVKELFPKAPFPKTKGKFEHVADAVSVGLALVKNGEWDAIAKHDEIGTQLPF